MIDRALVEAECHEGPVSVEAIHDPAGWHGVRLGGSRARNLGTDLELEATTERAERIETVLPLDATGVGRRSILVAGLGGSAA